MCAITGGTLSYDEAEKGIKYMHRGNDGHSIFSFDDHKVVFGFRRHSVIAPEDVRSMQPVVAKNNNVALVMNGEIFNYKFYKEKLLELGVNFESKGDAEVLLYLYLKDRDNFYKAVGESMCAVGVFDYRGDDPKIVIARDWIGEVPLHYVYKKDKKEFIFASEIKGLLGVVCDDIQDIKALEPGHVLEVNLNSFNSQDRKYFDRYNDPQKDTYVDLDSIGKELRNRLEKTAEARIISDVPVCCLLSGGVDSTITTYLVKKILDREGKDLSLYCFHVEGHPIDKNSDLYHARKVAKYFGIEKQLNEVCIQEDDIIEAIPEVIHGLEDTRSKDFNVYTAIYNHFLAKRIVADGFKVVFNGEGSDEFHGSYGSWGSFAIDPKDIIQIDFRKKMAGNLYKGVLQRTSKTMMYSGPLEMRSFFLSPDVGNYIMNIPPQFLRQGNVWKIPLVEAFEDVIPKDILQRPKERPQDVTGIMSLKEKIIDRYKDFGNTDHDIFSSIFEKKFIKSK
ncbi:MAG: asparagine synthetase B [Candidatus Pacebacteria bacterium]|nr:asparagine synthetase B [Candidatus Paceibacterota bacterium]